MGENWEAEERGRKRVNGAREQTLGMSSQSFTAAFQQACPFAGPWIRSALGFGMHVSRSGNVKPGGVGLVSYSRPLTNVTAAATQRMRREWS